MKKIILTLILFASILFADNSYTFYTVKTCNDRGCFRAKQTVTTITLHEDSKTVLYTFNMTNINQTFTVVGIKKTTVVKEYDGVQTLEMKGYIIDDEGNHEYHKLYMLPTVFIMESSSDSRFKLIFGQTKSTNELNKLTSTLD